MPSAGQTPSLTPHADGQSSPGGARHTGRQNGGVSDRQTDRQTDRETERQTDRQADRNNESTTVHCWSHGYGKTEEGVNIYYGSTPQCS